MTAYDALGQAYEMSETGDLESVIKNLASLGYVIIRDPAHAPEAVEAAWKALTAVGPRAATLCEVYHANNVCICQAEARAAITAYIERAR